MTQSKKPTRCEVAQIQVYLCADTSSRSNSRVPGRRERLALERRQGGYHDVVDDSDAHDTRHDGLGPDVRCEYPDDQAGDGDLGHRDGQQGGPNGDEVVEPGVDPLLHREGVDVFAHAAIDSEEGEDAAGPQEYLGPTSATVIVRVGGPVKRLWTWSIWKHCNRHTVQTLPMKAV